MNEITTAALAWHDHGYQVLPTRPDGTKAPTVRWTDYQTNRYPREGVAAVTTGYGLLCGAISGHLEMLELEGRAVAESFWPTIANLTLSDLDAAITWATITAGPAAYVEQTPSGGVHLLYRLADSPVPGNTKIASRPARDDEHTDQEREVLTRKPDKIFPRVLLETRGEGGYVVVAPSAGPTHETGKPWTIVRGTPGVVPTITRQQRDALHNLLHTLDRMPTHTPTPAATSPAAASTGGAGDGLLRPGDDFNQRTTWAQILEPHGWRIHYTDDGGITYWTRPGKTTGISASTNATGRDTLHVFTSSTEFDADSWHDKFGAHAILNHHGDHAAAAKELGARGYGEVVDQGAHQAELLAGILGHNPAPVIAAALQEANPVDEERPRLEILSTAEMADWLRDQLGTGQLAGMLLRGAEIVHTPRVSEAGYVPLSDRDGDADGPAQVRTVSVSTLRSRIQYKYTCVKFDREAKKWKPATFPPDAASLALGAPDEMRHLRRLDGVTHVPLVRPDGTLLDTPGYDPDSRLLYLPDRELAALPTANLTGHTIADAVAMVRYPLADFRWAGKHDEANYIGLMLTPLLRLLCPPPYKLGVITAHQPASGKSLLASLLRTLHGGVFRSEVPEDEPEMRKQITSILDMTTGPVVQFDNVSGILRSSTLAGLLTSARWDDRRLGGNTMVSARNDRLWIVTGNNANLGGDLVRRSIWVAIDPGVPNPELRHDFAIADLAAWTARHRGELLRALLILIRAWIAEGQPKQTVRADSYGDWIATVRGILEVAGIPGTFDHEESAQQTIGEDDQEWADFLTAVENVFGDTEWTVGKLLDHVNGPGRKQSLIDDLTVPAIPLDALPAAITERITRAGTTTAVGKSLGMWLKHRTGRWAGGRCVRAGAVDHNQRQWRIEAWTP